MIVEVMKLGQQRKETQIQQKKWWGRKLSCSSMKLPVQADSKVMLENLANKTKEYRRETENQGNNYAQESGEIPRVR